MPVIPEDPTVGRSPFSAGDLQAHADPTAFSQTGAAEAQGGQEVANVAEQFVKQYGDARANTAANNIAFDAMQKVNAAAIKWSNTPDHVAAMAGFNQDTQAIRQQAAALSTDPLVQAGVLSQLNRHSIYLGDSVGRSSYALESSKNRADLSNQNDQLAKDAIASTTPGLRQNNIDTALENIQRTQTGGWMTPEAANNMRKQFGRTLLAGELQANPDRALANLKSGAYGNLLDERDLEQLQPHIDAATTISSGNQVLRGAPVAPQPHPGASDAEADAALAPIIQRESGGNPYVGYTSPATLKAQGQVTDLRNAPIDATGVPIWLGDMGPVGISHAFSKYQFEPDTYRPIAKQLGITDWRAPGAMDAVARELYRQQGLAPWNASASGSGKLAGLYAQVDQMGLTDIQAAHTKNYVREQYDALQADQTRSIALADKQRHDTSLTAEDQVIADAFSGQPKMTAQQVANDPRLLPDARLRMIQVVGNAGEQGPLAGPSHLAALDLVNRIRLPDGDPQKITTTGPIYDALGANKLSKTDFDFVNKQFKDIATPGGEIFAQRKADFLKTVEPQIDPKGAIGSLDPAGKDRLYQFQWILDQKIDDYRNAKKNPLDLLDPSKPDFMGKPEAIKSFRSPLVVQLADTVNKSASVSRNLPAPDPDVSRQLVAAGRSVVDANAAASIVAAFRAGTMSREDATKALIDGKFAAPAPQSPSAPNAARWGAPAGVTVDLATPDEEDALSDQNAVTGPGIVKVEAPTPSHPAGFIPRVGTAVKNWWNEGSGGDLP